MAPEREPGASDPDDIDLDAVLEDFADRSGPDPAREPGVDPALEDEYDDEGDVDGGEPPPP